MDLKSISETDKRGIGRKDFVEQVSPDSAIFSYYGMGDSHEGIFSYDPAGGWKFVRHYDRKYEESSFEEKIEMLARLAKGLSDAGLTEVSIKGGYVEFSRPEIGEGKTL